MLKNTTSLAHVVILKLSAIGDVIMCMNIVEKIRRDNPNCRIDWICGKTVEPLLREYGKVDNIITLDEGKLFCGSLLERFFEILKLWFRILFLRCDILFIGHSDIRYRILVLPIIAKKRRVFSRGFDRTSVIPGRYHGSEYVRIFSKTDYCGEEFDFTLKFHQLSLAERFFLRTDGERYVVISPGGAKNYLRDDALRRWPVENYVKLTSMLLEENLKVILIGAKSDEWCNPFFLNMNVLNLIGKTDLLDLISIFQRCDLLVTHDSGPLHLGVISGIKVLALFGPTIPFEKIPPLENMHFIWGGEGLACRPCYDGRNYAPCSDNKCMKMINPNSVFEKVRNILNF